MTDLLIVGGGPAGLAAAARAGSLGLDATLVDENATPGGQYYRQCALPSAAPGAERIGQARDARTREGEQAIRRAASAARLVLGSSVFAIDPEPRAWLTEGDGARMIAPSAVLLATGAYDLPVAFPGWTLPGVISGGAVQALVKGQVVRPGKRAVVAGSGPFIWVVASELRRAGVRVLEVVEATTLGRAAPLLPATLRAPGRLAELAGYVAPLVATGTRVSTGQIVIAAEGGDRVKRVRLRPCRSSRQPAAADRVVEADLLCVAYGFSASTELARLAGCRLTWDVGLGQLVPAVDEWQATDRPGIFVAGEACGLGGAAVAALEGELAAIGAARMIGRVDAGEALRLAADVRIRLRRARAFAALLPRLFPRPVELGDLGTYDTMVCRCENVFLADALRAVEEGGARGLNEVKTSTRCGMGWCQGRICGPALGAILARRHPGFDSASAFTARPPVRAVSLGAIAGLDTPAQITDLQGAASLVLPDKPTI